MQAIADFLLHDRANNRRRLVKSGHKFAFAAGFGGKSQPTSLKRLSFYQIDAGENLIDLVISVRFIAGTFVCQHLRINFGLAVRKIVLKDFRKVLLKVCQVVIGSARSLRHWLKPKRSSSIPRSDWSARIEIVLDGNAN